MNENLKVNANTTILEFKRKHNLLVEGIENGTLNNVKPIYYHPIYFAGENWNIICAFTILDNNPTPYNANTFATKVKELCDGGALVQVLQGAIRKQTSDNYSTPMLVEKANTTASGYRIFTLTSNDFDVTYDFDEVMATVGNNFIDGVNKIN